MILIREAMPVAGFYMTKTLKDEGGDSEQNKKGDADKHQPGERGMVAYPC